MAGRAGIRQCHPCEGRPHALAPRFRYRSDRIESSGAPQVKGAGPYWLAAQARQVQVPAAERVIAQVGVDGRGSFQGLLIWSRAKRLEQRPEPGPHVATLGNPVDR